MTEAFESTNGAWLGVVPAGFNVVVMGFRWRKVVRVEEKDHSAVAVTSQGDELPEAYP